MTNAHHMMCDAHGKGSVHEKNTLSIDIHNELSFDTPFIPNLFTITISDADPHQFASMHVHRSILEVHRFISKCIGQFLKSTFTIS